MASTYRQVGYGSTGSAVSKLQTVLNEHGYDLAVDGIFGVKTQAAVRDYQQRNGLKLDGIAGPETWGSLLAQPTAPVSGGSTGRTSRIIHSGLIPERWKPSKTLRRFAIFFNLASDVVLFSSSRRTATS